MQEEYGRGWSFGLEKNLEHDEQSIMGYSNWGRGIEDQNTERNNNSRDPGHGVSENKGSIMNWARGHSCAFLAMNSAQVLRI